MIILLKSCKYCLTKLVPFYLKIFFDNLFGNNPYKKSIKKWKNKYKGKRCFIIATGPSLTLDDLELVKNEYTFSMNSIVKLFDKTKWRPTFYVLQDMYAYSALKPLGQYFDKTKLFVSEQISNDDPTLSNVSIFRLRPYHDAWLLIKNRVHFSKNCSCYVVDGRTITYSIIQIAYYMGFNEIYLLGVDWNYQKGKDNHMRDLSFAHDRAAFIENSHDIQMKGMHISYESAERFSRKHGFRIFNAGRGGNLDVFERVKLEDILEDKKDE